MKLDCGKSGILLLCWKSQGLIEMVAVALDESTSPKFAKVSGMLSGMRDRNARN